MAYLSCEFVENGMCFIYDAAVLCSYSMCMKFEAIEKALGRIDSTKKTAEYYDDNTAKAHLVEWS